MTIYNLPQRPEENPNSSSQLHEELIVPDSELVTQLLSAEHPLSDVQFGVDLSKQHDFVTEDVDALPTTVEETEDWCWVEMTDELEFIDEEERSELAEIEEDKTFYASKMRM